MMRSFTDVKCTAITAAMFYAAALAAVLCCGCSDHDIPVAFVKQRAEHVTKSTFTDPRQGGQTYKTVRIGNQTWMAENLNYAISATSTDSSWCYGNSPDNCAKYGRLYTWSAAKSACQGMGSGWHLPSREEWNTLVRYAGGGEAGKRLKSKSGWNNNGNGTDDFGFSALPGGYRFYADGGFNDVGRIGRWWSATEYGSDNAYLRYMDYDFDSVYEYDSSRSNGFSARCVGGSQD